VARSVGFVFAFISVSKLLKRIGSVILCVISLTYIVVIDLCVLCVSVVSSTHCPKTVSQNTFYPPNLRELRILYFVIISVIRSVLAGKNIPTLAQL
jgi:hypothetical protein